MEKFTFESSYLELSLNVFITGPRNPKVSEARYKKMSSMTRVLINFQTTLFNEAFFKPLR
jgi:hypothetical protein